MSNLPPNPYNNMPGGPQVNANVGPPIFNHSQQFGQVPPSQLPPGYAGMKQDANSNSPLHPPTSAPQNNALQNVNNYNQSGNSSPAFNQPGVMPPTQPSFHSSPMRPPTSGILKNNLSPVPLSSSSPLPVSKPNPSTTTPYGSNFQPPRQINDNAPPLVPSSQFSQPLTNGPPHPSPAGSTVNQYPPSSSGYNSPLTVNKPANPISSYNPSYGPPPVSKPGPGQVNQPGVPFSAPQSGPPRNSPLLQGPPASGPPLNGPSGQMPGPPLGPPQSMGINGPQGSQMTPASGPLGPPKMSAPGLPPIGAPSRPMGGPPGPFSGPPISMGGPMGPMSGPNSMSGPPNSMSGPPGPIIGPPGSMGSLPGPTSAPPGPINGPPGPLSGPPKSMSGPPGPINGPPGPMGGPPGPMSGPPSSMGGPPPGPMSGPRPQMGGPPSQPYPGPPRNGQYQAMPPSGPQSLPAQFPPMPQPVGPPSGPAMSNIQSRYPQAPQGNLNQPNSYQYNAQAMTQQMGQLSVTKQGFDQLWGHHMVDLLQCRQILPEYPEDPPEIKLGHQFADSPNCSPEIFRCTVNRIPETNSLLQKSRLPLGILIHPFKDLNHLPVIQCNTIVRCRACRTYINPFVYFVDAKRWKCNLCFRVNDLPEEFQYDPVSKSYGDPSRRPEIKSATIEFIAPGEYMLRPPQPAVYLFLLDVSQLARESGYLQVICETLKNSLDQLPGDARTQVGFICFDSHVHYYLMREGLNMPKEMTVLDIEDIFLPSPESLLVNLAECREIVKELLTVLPQRYSAPGVPGCALGAALQAAYKLMAPTGGRITVFQTCLPNVGPGALQPREDPNARSSKDVAHLNPATDFYKRIALECSGAQVAVDLFLLNSQYSDLATLSGMSKFSGGTVYHIPLFKSSRPWQADQLHRMFTRYLTRKIGFEAVMRVRCTRGIAIHTFHGNFFVRSTDLLSLPNVSPDAGFAMQLTIEESLTDLQQACFQAALLYTSSKGERRIRVHTLALPIATTLPDVLHSADQQCIIGLLSKMAVDRAVTASLGEAREAVMNVAVDALSAHRLAQNLPAAAPALHAPAALRLLPLLLLATLKRKAFRTGTSTRLDDRVADMCSLKAAPLSLLLLASYPALYPVHELRARLQPSDDGEEMVPDPPRLHLTAERVNSTGAYLLDDGESMILYIGHNVSAAFLSETLGVAAFSQIPDECRTLPTLDTEGNGLLHAFIERLNDDRPYVSDILILRDNSPSRTLFTERLVDDRVESAFSYYEFLQHVKSQVK